MIFVAQLHFFQHLIRIMLWALQPNSKNTDKLESRNQKWKFKDAWKCLCGPSCTAIITKKLVYQEIHMTGPHITSFFLGLRVKKEKGSSLEPQLQGHNTIVEGTLRILCKGRKEAFLFSQCDSILPRGKLPSRPLDQAKKPSNNKFLTSVGYRTSRQRGAGSTRNPWLPAWDDHTQKIVEK